MRVLKSIATQAPSRNSARADQIGPVPFGSTHRRLLRTISVINTASELVRTSNQGPGSLITGSSGGVSATISAGVIDWSPAITKETGSIQNEPITRSGSTLFMTSILDEIVERKKAEVRRASKAIPLDRLEAQLEGASRVRPFAVELAREPRGLNANVIAEIKRMSPSAGLIREDFDPVDIAGRYHASGAMAISCLTDEHYFGGKLAYLQEVREAVPLPVLRKDFIIDRYQVAESRVHGADAILLIAECLDDESLVTCHQYAHSIGLSILVEVHSAENLQRVLDLVAIGPDQNTLLGINNRDLTRMETNLDQTARLLESSEAARIPRGWVVSESGIRTSEDLAALKRCGVHTVLVGEHLMSQPDPGAALAEMLS